LQAVVTPRWKLLTWVKTTVNAVRLQWTVTAVAVVEERGSRMLRL
jgi:hypothetical protein